MAESASDFTTSSAAEPQGLVVEELAHALYTVWKHAGAPTDGIIAARVRGAVERVPWLAERYPELKLEVNREPLPTREGAPSVADCPEGPHDESFPFRYCGTCGWQ